MVITKQQGAPTAVFIFGCDLSGPRPLAPPRPPVGLSLVNAADKDRRDSLGCLLASWHKVASAEIDF